MPKVKKITPKELIQFPPFFDVDDDMNSLMYYSFEQPNYFKLFDMINATKCTLLILLYEVDIGCTTKMNATTITTKRIALVCTSSFILGGGFVVF